MKIESEVKVKDLPEFQAAIEAEKQKVKVAEDRLKAEQDARAKADAEKNAALDAKAKMDEEKRIAKVAIVRAKFGESIPEEVVKDLPSDKLDYLASDKAPAPKKADTPAQEKKEGISKAPPNGAPPTTQEPKKEPWFNRDGMAYHVEEPKGEHDAKKHMTVAKQRCQVHEKVIATEIRKHRPDRITE
jgi:DNA-binding TFAR19-related protein (PDSD5 family)